MLPGAARSAQRVLAVELCASSIWIIAIVQIGFAATSAPTVIL